MRAFHPSRLLGALILAVSIVTTIVGCGSAPASPQASDVVQRRQNEKLLQEATAQTGMPAITNFRERKMLKEIIELRDQTGLATYTYVVNEMQGKLMFLGESIGYGIPAATQYTNPQKDLWQSNSYGLGGITVPQADPNGLFSPDSAEGTWVLLKDPNGSKVKPVYVETRIIVSPFKLTLK